MRCAAQIIGEGKKDTQNQEGETNDGDREEVADSILPETGSCFFEVVLDFLKN